MSLVALCNNLDYFRKATTDTGISLIASDLIISCRTKKVKQYGGCAELCASLFRKKGSYKNVIFFEKNVISFECHVFEKCHCFQCHIARHRKVCYVILAKEGKQKGQQVGQKNLSIARVND